MEPLKTEAVFAMTPPRGVYIAGQLENFDVSVGVDSLSYYSVVSRKLLDESGVLYSMSSPDIGLSGAGGANVQVVGQTDIVLTVAGTRLNVNVYIADDFPRIFVLGLAAQEAHNVTIRTNTRLVDINGVVVPYYVSSDKVVNTMYPLASVGRLNNVHLAKSVVMPPQQEMICLAKVDLPKEEEAELLEVDPVNINSRYGLLAACVVVKADSVIPIVI